MKSISSDLLDQLVRRAAAVPRGRTNHNLHPSLDDPIQRFVNALQPGTYVRPHRHSDRSRWEVFLALRGRAVVLAFNRGGIVTERREISPSGPDVAVEVGGGSWHTVAALSRDTVLFELKPGPYSPIDDKDFAVWAPPEGDPESALYAAWFTTAGTGDGPPGGARSSGVDG
jgi:cupin fold WbuC family metalloprotein